MLWDPFQKKIMTSYNILVVYSTQQKQILFVILNEESFNIDVTTMLVINEC